jgi:hypothetical protein
VILTKASSFSNNTEEVPEYFENLSEKGKSISSKIKDVEVPEDFVDTHTDALKLGEYAYSIKEEISSIKNDPIAKIISISKIENLLSLTQSFADNNINKLSSLGIDVSTFKLQ